MLKKLLELLSNFFSSLFGSKKTEPVAKPTTRPANQDDIIDDSSALPADTVILEIPVADVDKILAQGSSPFGDEDKEGAFEEPSELPTPSSTPSTGTGAGTTSTGTGSGAGTSTTGTGSGTSTPGTGTSTSTGGGTTTTTPTVPPATTTQKPRFLWCLNNGHGRLQEGKRSPIFDDGVTQFLEYKFNRDIVVRIMKALDKYGVKYFDVVPDVEEVGVFPARVKRANDKVSDLPKIYVAVHANAASPAPGSKWGADSAKGIETWHSANSKKGILIAKVFQRHLVEKTGWKDRGLKSTAEQTLFELRDTNMPAVLTENGFFSHREEVKELMKDSVRQKIADAHVAAILEIEKNGIV